MNAGQRLLILVYSTLVKIKLVLILADGLLLRRGWWCGLLLRCRWRSIRADLRIEIIRIGGEFRNLLVQVLDVIVDLLEDGCVLRVYKCLRQIPINIQRAFRGESRHTDKDRLVQVV